MTWYLIETLAPAPSASIVFKEGEPRDWTSVRTLTRSDGLDMIEDLIAEVRTSRDSVPWCGGLWIGVGSRVVINESW
ncbi:GAF domain-containing protein [Gordonia paraffinivorans]|uniref:GAF domain-containing protein n=1 Tax=Gordonia paraffinivorans TaxID=175628 RepID=UPI001FF8C218|nr:GAF domain-containing protein [Gordonia paraffinivorans]